MPSIETLLEQNRKWANRTKSENPEAWQRMSEPQHPRHCMICCSDNRVPMEEILGIEPGQMFVHRNIANMVSHQDLNCISFLNYAVNSLEVERIIICGHYGCGGITAALQHKQLGLTDYWLHQLQLEADLQQEELSSLSEEEQIDRMCEWNVHHQVESVVSTSIVRNAWKKGRKLYVHGWIFSHKTGLITPLTDAIGPESMDTGYTI